MITGRFRRSGDKLSVGAVGSLVTITTAGGCVLHVATPGTVDMPAKPCVGLGLRVRPRVLTTGTWKRVTAQVSPATEGVAVRLGTARAGTDDQGIARLRVCVSRPGRRQARASIADRLPGTAHVAVRGRAKRCR
jgi:hypothetical protein